MKPIDIIVMREVPEYRDLRFELMILARESSECRMARKDAGETVPVLLRL